VNLVEMSATGTDYVKTVTLTDDMKAGTVDVAFIIDTLNITV